MGTDTSMSLTKPQRKKVRTGCTTCKIRRVKCDEQKPSCQRCISTGRKCDGYQYLAPTEISPEAIANLAVMIPGTRQERRAFDFFRTCTAPYLCGYFSEEFWERNVLQASYTQPALRHTAVAIGALHETFNMLTTTPESGPLNHFALAQYTKAINNLRTSMVKQQQQPDVALMACVLFVCFDSLLGNADSAIMHLRSGMDILRTNPSLDTKVLGTLFTRLGLQAISFTDDRSNYEIESSFAWKLPVEPPSSSELSNFSSLQEARNTLNCLIDSMMQFFYTIPGRHNTPESPASRDAIRFGTPNATPPHVLVRRELFAQCLRDWSKAFNDLLSSSNLNLSSKDLRAATLLKIHHTTATIMIQATLLSPYEAMGRFTPEFAQIVSLCASLAKADLPQSGQNSSYFSTDLGIIAPLYHTALNCHDIQVKTAALKVLQIPRREGMWDSRIAAFVIERVMKLEAEGISVAMPNDGYFEGSEESKEQWEKLLFNRTPREAADQVDHELRQAGSGHWITYGNLIPWQQPSIFERAAMEREFTALREELNKVQGSSGESSPA